MLLCFCCNFRELMIENFMQFGWLVDVSLFNHIINPYEWPGVFIILSLNVYVLLALLIEKLGAKGVDDKVVLLLHGINNTLLLIVGAYLVKVMRPVFISGLVVSLLISTLWMKLFSYAHVNYQLRNGGINIDGVEDKKENENGENGKKVEELSYPNNLTLKNIYYFIAIPTLCYQLHYPKIKGIRFKTYLIRKLTVGILLSGVVFIIGNQYLYPLIVGSLHHIDNTNYIKVFDIILKASIPNLYLWILGFYVLFDIYLNILGELTCFGDRKFYGDWWNAQTLGHYWNTWNLPVHYFLKRHIYYPFNRKFNNRFYSLMVCFLISAFFHEYVLSVPFGQLKFWAFIGISAQVPLIVITEKFKHHHYTGNIIFWTSIALGQPFIVMMYYRDYVKNYNPS